MNSNILARQTDHFRLGSDINNTLRDVLLLKMMVPCKLSGTRTESSGSDESDFSPNLPSLVMFLQ